MVRDKYLDRNGVLKKWEANIMGKSRTSKEKSSNNVVSRRALDSGKLNIGRHALEKYGKHEKK